MTIEFLKKLPATKGVDEGIWNLFTPIPATRIMSGEEITIIAFADQGERAGQVEDAEGRWFYVGTIDHIQ